MKPLFRNIFLLFGIGAIIVMLCTFDDGWEQIRQNIARAGLYLPAVIGTWILVYACNALAFQTIVNTADHDKHLSFRHAYKLTVSGFAFSYTTPFGFGGGPYRVMELANFIGFPRAISSVTIYSMMHILSHFCLWTTALLLFVGFYIEKMTTLLWWLFGIYLVVLIIAIALFAYSYRHGIVEKLYRVLLYIPFIKHRARRFLEANREAFTKIDSNIIYLGQHPKVFWGALGQEYIGRVINAFEFYFILHAFGLTQATFVDAILVLGFSSLMGNLLFFLPMQLGAREGGLAIIISILFGASGSIGIFTSFYTRIRELFWIFVGVGLVKIGNKRIMK